MGTWENVLITSADIGRSNLKVVGTIPGFGDSQLSTRVHISPGLAAVTSLL